MDHERWVQGQDSIDVLPYPLADMDGEDLPRIADIVSHRFDVIKGHIQYARKPYTVCNLQYLAHLFRIVLFGYRTAQDDRIAAALSQHLAALCTALSEIDETCRPIECRCLAERTDVPPEAIPVQFPEVPVLQPVGRSDQFLQGQSFRNLQTVIPAVGMGIENIIDEDPLEIAV